MNWRYHFRCRQRRNIFEGHACRQRSKLRSKIIMTTFSPACSPVVHLVCGSACTACVLNYSYSYSIFSTHTSQESSLSSPSHQSATGPRARLFEASAAPSGNRTLAFLKHAFLHCLHFFLQHTTPPLCPYVISNAIQLI